MAEQKKEPLYLTIVDAAPELDFLFALTRRTKVSITFALDGIEQSRGVYIDSLAVGKGERIHPTFREFSKTWLIEGHFWGNGEDSWSYMFWQLKDIEKYGTGFMEKGEEIELWGSFQGVYNRGKRKGQISTTNYKKKPTNRLGIAKRVVAGTKIEVWCIKCRVKVELENFQLITMKNLRHAAQGKCPVCGTPVYRMGVSEEMIKNSKQEE